MTSRRLLALLLAAMLVIACGGGSSNKGGASAAKPPAFNGSYEETCSDCGLRWKVTLIEPSAAGPRLEVQVQNSGERGRLGLAFDQVGTFALNDARATQWRGQYGAAKAAGNALEQMRTLAGNASRWRPASTTRLPADLAPGDTWTGQFEAAANAIPADSAAIVLFIGPVNFEKAVAGQPNSDFMLSWDKTRPFIGLHGEVLVTPIAVSPTPVR